ncbi:MAG: hypothetical protein ABI469_08660, partial [Gemmatimonadales bacterium]
YRIANSATPLVCPSITAPGVHGYVLTATVQPLGGDSAIATVRRTCLDPERVVITGENILLARKDGKWQIERILNGFNFITV